jgi:hypothetical protein
VTPALPRPARPLDLFQEATPRVWHTRLDGPAGAWHLLALFNWSDDTPAVIPVPLAALGIGAGEYVTVFDVWEGQYRGTATHELPVQVPRGSVRLLGLRAYTGEPMLLASNRHIGMGALDHKEVRWDAQSRTLSGSFEAVADFDYVLHCLLPVGHNVQSATCSAGAVTFAQDKRVVRLQFRSAAAGPCRWSVRM